MKSIETKQDGLYFIHSQYRNGYYLGYREDDNWGRGTEKSWAVLNGEEIIEWQFKTKYNWREWISDTIKRFGERSVLSK
jgi:hypothetical protein